MRKYHRTRTMNESRVARLCALLQRFGFTEERDGFSNYSMGWSRFYNLSRATNRKTYKPGAMGVQLDWRFNAAGECTTTVTTWRNGSAS